MKTYVIIPTISIPEIAIKYCHNFDRYGHKNNIGILIIGDEKSPIEQSFKTVMKLQKKGFEVEFIDIKREKQWVKKYKHLSDIIRYNSDSRRIIGFLMALERKCDAIISVDDDNYPVDNIDFYKYHIIVGKKIKLPTVSTNTGWFNVCQLLQMDINFPIFPRGFPYSERNKIIKTKKQIKSVTIGVNAGLWLNDPDIDSITRLSLNPKSLKYIGKQIAIAKNCNTPINTQNTALVKDLIPAYYYVLMGEPVDGLILDRDGDIWTGFFLKKTMNSLGYHLSIGQPISNHYRNTHNFFNDLRFELGCIMYTGIIANLVENTDPKGNSVIEIYDDLSKQFLKSVLKEKLLTRDFKNYAKKLYRHQQIWLDTVQQIVD